MSDLSSLLLREVVNASYQTKNATLTFAEVDDNFILLANAIKENIIDVNPSGIEAYSGATEYSNGDLVTYAGNLWEYTNPTPSTGNVPASGSTFWTLQSAGVLAHRQNTDTHTTSNRFGVGDSANTTNKELFALTGAPFGSEPRLRYNVTSGLWEISHDGATFLKMGGGTSTADTGLNDADEIELDMANLRERVFTTADPITASVGMDIANGGNGVKASWLFEIQNLATVHFSDDILLDDARANDVKQWTPYDNGVYKAEFTKYGTKWVVERIAGPFI